MRSRVRLRPWALATASVALMVPLAACGGGTPSEAEVATLAGDTVADGAVADGAVADDTTADEVTAVDSSEAILDFAACMRDNGIDMADPTFDADGNAQGLGPGAGADQAFDPRSEEFRTAMDSCGDLLGDADFGGPGRRGGFDREAIQEAFNGFTACLRDEGVQVDDLTLGAGPGAGAGGGGAGAGAGDAAQGQPPGDGQGGGFAGGGAGQGPPADGDGPGGEGFDPAARIIEQLDLDDEDSAVTAAVETCQPTLDDAFTAPADDADA